MYRRKMYYIQNVCKIQNSLKINHILGAKPSPNCTNGTRHVDPKKTVYLFPLI